MPTLSTCWTAVVLSSRVVMTRSLLTRKFHRLLSALGYRVCWWIDEHSSVLAFQCPSVLSCWMSSSCSLLQLSKWSAITSLKYCDIPNSCALLRAAYFAAWQPRRPRLRVLLQRWKVSFHPFLLSYFVYCRRDCFYVRKFVISIQVLHKCVCLLGKKNI